MTLHTLRKLLGSLLVLCAIFASQQSFALSCRQGSYADTPSPTGSISQSFPIGSVSFAKSDFTAGNVLWRSSTYTATFTCWDMQGYPGGEDAWLYWNPQGGLSKIDPSLSVGVTINGKDYDSINTAVATKAIDVGRGTIFDSAYYAKYGQARPLTISFTFSIYLKATGVAPQTTFTDIGTAGVFQVDGVLGINSTPNSNYVANLTNFNNIRVIQCTPTVTISPSNINFGNVMRETSAVGKIAKTIPFTVTANVSGGGCVGQQLVASFSSNDVSTSDPTLLIPSTKPGIGVYLTSQSNTGTPLVFGQVYPFTTTAITSSSTTTIPVGYIAYLKWLTNSPTVGTFNTTATVNITFK
ncbi:MULTISPECIES: fimbrial protein [Tatumella]|uniref:fimbrial protein n=1 Tax=Tatumella TaxID=82986 RepID=UPI0004700B1A|nr:MULTISPECIES: fimbrial protein [Tatumella]